MTREEAIKILKDASNPEYTWSEYCKAYNMAIKVLEQEPRKGHWLTHKEFCDKNNLLPSGLGSYFWCSECNCGIDVKEWHRSRYNYCPNCGAKMDEDGYTEHMEELRMILSNIYGDCSKSDFDLIVRGRPDQVKHELMHILLSMKPDDVMDIIEMWLRQIMEDMNENDTDINHYN